MGHGGKRFKGRARVGGERPIGAANTTRCHAPPPPPGRLWSALPLVCICLFFRLYPPWVVVKQDKSSRGSVDTTKTRPDPRSVRMSSGERPIGAAKGKQPNTEALCQPPPLWIVATITNALWCECV